MIESYRVAGLRTSSATRILSHVEFSTPAAAGIAHSEQQAIHFSLVNTLRESEARFGLLHRGFQLFGRKFQIQTREIVLELRYLPLDYTEADKRFNGPGFKDGLDVEGIAVDKNELITLIDNCAAYRNNGGVPWSSIGGIAFSSSMRDERRRRDIPQPRSVSL
jgi:hypothetical protein